MPRSGCLALHGVNPNLKKKKIIGLITQLFKVLDLKQAVFTYLLPIEKPIINYDAIIKMFTGSERLSKQANIKYTQHHFGCCFNN